MLVGVSPLSSNGIIHSDSVKKSNILNNQSTSVVTIEDTTSIPHLSSTNHPSARPIVVNRKGVLKLLKDNPFKATGPDANPGRLLKTLSDEVMDILSTVFQASLDQWTHTSCLEESLHLANIQERRGYRPISLTSICCKILEPIVHSHVMSHLDTHDAQHGFLWVSTDQNSPGLSQRSQWRGLEWLRFTRFQQGVR